MKHKLTQAHQDLEQTKQLKKLLKKTLRKLSRLNIKKRIRSVSQDNTGYPNPSDK